MGTKNNPGAINCYAALKDDEPFFVLKSTDESAPLIVRIWAEMYRTRKMIAGQWTNGAIAKYTEAIDLANEMTTWYLNNEGIRGLVHSCVHLTSDHKPCGVCATCKWYIDNGKKLLILKGSV